MPFDFYYVHSKVNLYKNRRMKIVADKFLFKVPGKIKIKKINLEKSDFFVNFKHDQ